ncbi:arginine deiminase [Spiroplasma sp. AdecLV25b]|uniref:arginine deiminase n=1 Tax=Spiroplasma sp. AdecLV25b TaxID=3027162 RepID=UPI0027E1B36E|nr:arginine deiminase [Spiroplasma sp. AdecLV25b]
MNNKNAINVYSEIGKLRTVLLHRPGEELSNLTPDLLERLLFDDTPDLFVAQTEHDQFAEILTSNGVEVLYIEKLAAETIALDEKLRTNLINQFLKESGCKPQYLNKLQQYLNPLNHQQLIDKMIAGVTKFELEIHDNDKYPLIVDPLPNLLFQRDPFASIGNGATINHMFSETRRRETLFIDLVLNHHLRFKDQVNFWYNRSEKDCVEGGDILVLNDKHVIMGVSQRTTMNAIKKCATRLINDGSNQFEKVIVLDLKTKNRAFIHLDTVFTNIDYDKFIAHALIFETNDQFKIWEITKNGNQEIKETLNDYLSTIIGKPVTFIKCGGEDPIDQAREQWNDGNNVLTIAPGVVIAYGRNHITVEKLKEQGIKVYQIASAELSRGRGGPRFMSMPIIRENI